MTKIELDLNELLGMDYDEDGDPIGRRDLKAEIVGRAAELLVAEHRREAKSIVTERITAAIDAEVTGIVQTALAAPIQRRKPWGDPDGEPTTVLEIARDKLGDYLALPARSDGYDRAPKNLSALIDDVVRGALSKEFAPAVAAARAAVTARVQVALTTAIAANVTEGR